MAIRLAAGDQSLSGRVAGNEALTASGISKFFGGMQALKTVDLTLRAGEVHALVGANGAGKSTLSRILCGHLMPEAGEIRIRGRPVRFASPRDGLAAGVAMVTQETTLAPDLPVIENIFLPRMGSPGRLSRPGLARESEAIIADLDIALGFSLSDRVGDLSIAERQLVEVLKALAGDPDIIFFDEPTTSLSPYESERLFGMLSILSGRGKAIVLVSHRMEEIFQVSDRISVLKEGRIVGSGIESSKLSPSALITLMVGKELSEVYARHLAGPAKQAGAPVLRVSRLAIDPLVSDVPHPTPAPSDDGGVVSGPPDDVTHARYDLSAGPLRFGAVPYPDDAYLNDQGHVSVRDIPSNASAAYSSALAEGLSELDGFGARPTVYVHFDGALDPESLPSDAEASLMPDASVFMVDADTTSTWAYQRIPVEVRYVAKLKELRIVPAYGRPLAAGRRYAAVITTGVQAADGSDVAPSPQLARILDASEVLDEPDESAARSRYEPVLSALAQRGLARRKVAAIAAFVVQSAGTDLQDARELLYGKPAPVLTFDRIVSGEALDALLGMPDESAAGLDDGAPHAQIGLLAQGHVELPSLISSRPEVHGSLTRDAAGALLVQGRAQQPFTLWLPRNVSPAAPMPLLLVLHDEGGERGDAAAIANALCGRGYAVVAPDAPFHGLRAGGVDTRARFTGAEEPDGFGDMPGDFVGLEDKAGEQPEGDPVYYRDAVRQAAIDTMGLLRALSEAEFDGFAEQSTELAAARLQSTRTALLGIGLGAEVAVLLAPLEPSIDAAVLAFPGGQGVDGWLQAPAAEPLAEALFARLGRSADDVDWTGDPPATWPDVDAFRALSDRGSALAQAALLRRSPANLLVLMAKDDERAPNGRTEALAAALGARPALAGESIDPELVSDELRPGDTVRANVSLEVGDLTRTLVVLDPATHDTLSFEHGRRAFETPQVAPFTPLAKPKSVDNPTAAALMQIAYFFESLRGCEPATRSPCSATALVP